MFSTRARTIRTITASKLYHNEFCLPFGVQFQFDSTHKFFAIKFLCWQVAYQANFYKPFVIPAPRAPRRNARGQFVSDYSDSE